MRCRPSPPPFTLPLALPSSGRVGQLPATPSRAFRLFDFIIVSFVDVDHQDVLISVVKMNDAAPEDIHIVVIVQVVQDKGFKIRVLVDLPEADVG